MKKLFRKLFNKTLTCGQIYEGDITKIDYFQLMCSVGPDIYENNQVCMFKHQDCVLIVIALPLSSRGAHKNLSERTIEVVKDIEEIFEEIRYVKNQIVEYEKFSYLVFLVKGMKYE